jgi:hypothetical protein
VKDILAWFCVGFAFFFVAGGIVGRLNRVPPEEAVDLVAVRHVALTTKNGESVLTFICKSHDYFDYYLHDGSLIPDRQLLDHPFIPKPISFEGIETIFVAASGWELRNVVVSATGAALTNREKVGLVLGSISGFYAGRWLFSTRLPDCASSEVLSRVQKVEYWDKLKRAKCKELCLGYRLWFYAMRTEPLVLEADRLKKSAESLPDARIRDNVVSYLNMLQRIFRASSSSDAKMDELDFSHASGGIPYLLEELDNNPQVLKTAFPKWTPALAYIVNEDPEVTKREVAERTLTLNFHTTESYEKDQAVFQIIEVIFGGLVVGVLLAVVVMATGFLVRKRHTQPARTVSS